MKDEYWKLDKLYWKEFFKQIVKIIFNNFVVHEKEFPHFLTWYHYFDFTLLDPWWYSIYLSIIELRNRRYRKNRSCDIKGVFSKFWSQIWAGRVERGNFPFIPGDVILCSIESFLSLTFSNIEGALSSTLYFQVRCKFIYIYTSSVLYTCCWLRATFHGQSHPNVIA